MKHWKLIGALAVALAVFAIACGGGDGDGPGDATPGEGTPAGTPTDVTPAATPAATSTAIPPIVLPSPAVCEPVEAEPPDSSIPLADVLPEGKIAFVSFRDEYEGRTNREIYLITADGEGPINLTRNSCADDEPDWAPDGTKIAWESDRDGSFEIYVMDVDGGNVTQLTTNGGLAPRWSPDGKLIAYTRGGSIWVMKADGSDQRVVLPAGARADEENLCTGGGFPGGWSPDGGRIVYYSTSLAGALGQVCTVTVDGSDVEVVVSDPPVYNVEPVWSPDGQRIAYRSIQNGNHDVWVVNLKDGSKKRLTKVDALDTEPDWSPDSEWIVFASNRDGVATDIYVMRADGSDVRRLTEDPAKDSYPVWSP